MNLKRTLTILLAVIFVAFGMSARDAGDKPVKWRMTVKMTSATEGVVTLRAIVGTGWHLYGTSLPEGGPIATSFDFTKSKGIVFIDKNFVPSAKPVSKTDKTFGMTLNWWESNLTFTRHFRLNGDVKDAVIAGSVRYMCCNDETCTPPSTENFKTTPKKYVKGGTSKR